MLVNKNNLSTACVMYDCVVGCAGKDIAIIGISYSNHWYISSSFIKFSITKPANSYWKSSTGSSITNNLNMKSINSVCCSSYFDSHYSILNRHWLWHIFIKYNCWNYIKAHTKLQLPRHTVECQRPRKACGTQVDYLQEPQSRYFQLMSLQLLGQFIPNLHVICSSYT